MMATQSKTTPTNGSTPTAGNCGCGGAAQDCCQLDCLVQPRFFCGQLLTDQDLGTLVDWAKEKARLARFRHGWGVICGLQVQCDSANPDQVKVEPGYALGCCGDDIVVCTETGISLTGVCREAPDPCAGLRPAVDNQNDPPVDLGGFSLPGSQVRVVDIYISYREVGSDPQAALARTVCTAAAPCEFTRTKESFALSYQVAVRGSDPMRAAADEWSKNYLNCLQVVEQFVTQGVGAAAENVADVQRWLLRWIDTHPINQFCFLRDWICSKDGLKNEADVAKILFWMVQDCRNAFLACGCYPSTNNLGVPLARVWMQATKDSHGKLQCSVVGIDSHPPYRRMIRGECWPAPFGRVNVARVIWHRAEEARSILNELGISVADPVKFTIPKTVAELRDTMKRDELFGTSGDTKKVQTLEAGNLGTRVVAVTA